MSLRIVRSRSNAALWEACATRFLDEVGERTGPSGYPSHLWLAHRNQRDSLYERAAARGVRGWLAPPFSFLSELRDRFRIEARPIGILTGRLLVARLAARSAEERLMKAAARERGPARSHMIDGVLSELLPEGVEPADLRAALRSLGGDEFALRRSAWVADTYVRLLEELRRRDRYDPRQIHAMVAERIERGDLRAAIGDAGRLHIYGITSLRGRRRLFRALAAQPEVEVSVYLTEEEERSEWDAIGAAFETLPGPPEPPSTRVQPAPDSVREAAWVARRVKRLLVSGEAAPHEVAVVARSGREDTRRIHQALAAAGVPSTARIRTRLAEVPALCALLQLLRAEAEGWPYRALRPVLASPYLGPGLDLRAIDHIASGRRVEGLEAWEDALRRLRALLDTDRRWILRREGVFEDRLDEDLPRFAAFRRSVERLAGGRAEREWIALTLDLLSGEELGFRRRLCRPVADRHDIVRLDQRGVLALEALLREWGELVESPERFEAREWHARLRRLLEANEIALSTPLQTGVQVLEAHEAALTPFRQVFVVHANEGVFPASHSGTGVFTDSERRRLASLGLPLSGRDEALRRERTLWRAVTAGEDVTITYRTTDANGVPRLPSLMVPAHRTDDEIPRTVELTAAEDARWTTELEPVSERQVVMAEVQRLARARRGGDSAVFRTPDPRRVRRAVLAAFAEELRGGALDAVVPSERALIAPGAGRAPPPDPTCVFGNDRPLSERPTAWNGRLRDPVVLEELGRRFGDGYPWSASQLETYGRRPFDFLLERVLRLGEVEEAEEETTPLAFGSVAHAILERFYRELGSDPPPAFDERARRLYERVCEEVFGGFEGDLEQWLGLPPLWAVRREEVREKVAGYLEWELGHLARTGARPLLIEHRFGEGDEGDPILIEGVDRAGRPAHLLLRGRIDRVDRYPADPPWLRVVDYKSSRIPSLAGYDDGALLQTALYMRALEALGHRAVVSGVYRSIKRPQPKGVGAELRSDRVRAVLAFALTIPGRVRSGLFEAVQAKSLAIEEWQPGLEVTRTSSRITSGSRCDLVAE